MTPFAARYVLIFTLLGALGFGSVIMSTFIEPPTDMHIEPSSGLAVVGDTFTIKVIVASEDPVNVFQGLLTFDSSTLQVDRIDYNTSIADLWAELPWYSNGDGTVNFAGGTTHPGGFTGTGSLISITFKTIAPGNAAIAMEEARILRHDGFGTDTVVQPSIDAIFTVDPKELEPQIVTEKTHSKPTQLTVVTSAPDPDLNHDGKQTLADTSIFMTDLATQNLRSDFNRDGRVSTADLSILLNP